MQLSCASYNIHKAIGLDRRRDPDRILAVLREVDADIVALQEADLRFGERASVLPRASLDESAWHVVPVARRPRSIGWHGNALLARRNISIVDAHPLALPTLEPRGAALAILEREGERFCIVGMHLDLSGLRRRDQVRAVLRAAGEHAGNMPTILLGDLNQWGARTGAMQEFAGGSEGGWQVLAPGPSYPSRRPVARLDRIIASNQWHCTAAHVHHSALAAVASDHLPVWSRLELRNI